MYLPIYLYIYLPIYLSIYLSTYLSIKGAPAAEKKTSSGVKRKFGEVSESIGEMKPWTVR